MKRLAIFREISHLIFPELCLGCSRELSRTESHVCAICSQDLTLTHFDQFEDASPMDKLFWGRVKVQSSYAHFFFNKGKVIQEMLFGLKYHNNKPLGLHYGRQIGMRMSQLSAYNTLDALVPVPLHPKKAFIRGYNQSEIIAKGISENHSAKLDTDLIKRIKHSSSQTKKNRFQRWENVDGIFLVNAKIKNYKHVAIIDDMITTGSTVESIIRALRNENPDLSISVITLAIAI